MKHHTKHEDICHTHIAHLNVEERGAVILRDVSLELYCGRFTALIGPNGAGKSTLLRALIGEIKSRGLIMFSKASHRRPRIGYVPQKLAFEADNPANVFDLFLLACSRLPVWLFRPAAKRQEALRLLEEVQASYLIDRPLAALSGGELRRVFLALALAGDPELLLLDEPGTGMDQNGLENFYALISKLRREKDLSILMVAHDFAYVRRYADYVYLLDKGRMADSGAPQELFGRAPFLELFSL